VTLYEHLSVLFSIVIGLGLTHILAYVHELARARDRIRFHWLPITWAFLVFAALVQWWWSSFTFNTRDSWNFFYFLFVFMRPVVSYMSATFVLPRIEPNTSYDLREYYFDTRYWLFALLALGNTLDGVRRMFEGEAFGDIAVWSNFASATLLVSLAFTTNERYHATITLLTLGLFVVFLVQAALTLA
jgi:hypothetical protein